MRTMGISPGDAVLVVERRGMQQIVYNALVAGISMCEDLAGTLGEPAIEAAFVSTGLSYLAAMGGGHPMLCERDIVHISHRDWIEGRAGIAYEELPSPTPGVCRYCKCTERRACPGGCAWLFPEKTVCSNPECEARYVEDNKLRPKVVLA